MIRMWDRERAEWVYTASRQEGPGEVVAREVQRAWAQVRTMSAPEDYAMSWFKTKLDRDPKPLTRTLSAMSRSLTRWSAGAKEDLPLWSPARYPENTTRAKANVSEVSSLVLDYDDGTTIEQAAATWGMWAHVLYTTPSHGPDGPRFRLVLPLAVPVSASDWPRVWTWAEQHAGARIDKACKDASRMYYGHAGPRQHAVTRTAIERLPLLWVDVDRLPALPPSWGAVARPAPVAPMHYDEAVSRAVALLGTCPDTRYRAAALAGAQANQERAWGARCPRCGDGSVWWPIVPEKIRSAMCNHRKSCGWMGSIYEVIP
jgi:hypothetical protein